MPTTKSTKHAKRSSSTCTKKNTTTSSTNRTRTGTRTEKKPTAMIQYTESGFTMQPATSKYDESAADMSAYLDFSSYATHLSSTPSDTAIIIPTSEQPPSSSSFENAFGSLVASGLRPVDDSLLDSPLDLELSPASTFATDSSFSSPFLVDFEGDFSSSSASVSPVLASDFAPPTTTSTASYPSLFAPMAAVAPIPSEIDMAALASSLGVTLPPLSAAPPSSSAWAPPPPPAAPAPVHQVPTLSFIPEEAEEEEDVKPNVADLIVVDAPAPASKKRKTVAELKAEAEALIPALPFSSSASSSSSSSASPAPETTKRDKFTGIRNTKKPPVAYDAPTLPKNYYTESATSKKRASPSSSSSSSSSSKRARSASLVPTPAEVSLPSAQPEPIPEDEFDESQLSAIELKRRQNTLAARRSRARKSAYITELKDEIEELRRKNEELMRQLSEAQAGGAKCAACGGGGGAQ
ncbi:hypothetical protein JCM10908_002449 [Rhodotorula pacifica]|uniref:bZIP transcription factor n=1 Tax=Rhodotorula pacifica TaxID=1495444 RepID=UPI00317400A9